MKNKDLPASTLANADSAPDAVQVDHTLIPVESDLSQFSLDQNSKDSSGPDSQAGGFIGRYQIVRRLGRGGFGIVFLANDPQLDRMVAIKLPHVHRFENSDFQRMYLEEARTLAKLDFPSIVPIYDWGMTTDGRCFVVSKYIAGHDLTRLLSNGAVAPIEVARLISDIAAALHHVHRLRIVHRDIKPANILLSDDGRVYVADFGLAQREELFVLSAHSVVGTPNYMSPEQVRGEGHRVDGRSDQFSLGVVMYELLTGDRPFSGGSSQDVFNRILTLEPIPPRQINPNIPKELNRICLKLLSKLANHRYFDTKELEAELRDWLQQAELEPSDHAQPATVSTARSASLPSPVPTSGGSNAPTSIVPRGLRAYTRTDAWFFLDLLPGTRDRDGLPECVAHWKRWVSVREDIPDHQRIGVISGPTGCGKSSLIRAGLVPLLGPNVDTIVLEATPDLTEKQLQAAIQRHCPAVTSKSLPDALAEVRRGQSTSTPRTLLLIIDQFEQWLHAHPDPQDTELVRAMRQCDGIRIQCLLLIRDDFWLALTRFMDAVECPLQLGRNVQMVDLFDQRHARKVLTAFGRAYHQLPESPEPLTREHQKFLDGAIENLTTDGKVVPVHLSLFAEMVKSRNWTPATLKVLGGTVGIGAQFLHESFSATYAPANQRAHDQAARSILRALLPGLGTEIKSNRKTRQELLVSSGYESARSHFDGLMTILESDLKLISATDSLDRTRTDSSSITTEQTTYQLSHDFLVPSIREWLNAQQRVSWKGRLQQRISEQSNLWRQNQDDRFLPGIIEWAAARCVLPMRDLSPNELGMLKARDRKSISQIVVSSVAALVILLAANHVLVGSKITSLMTQLTTADSTQVLPIISQLESHGTRARSFVTQQLTNASPGSNERFLLQLADLNWSDQHLDETVESLLQADSAEYVPVVCEAISPYASRVVDRAWDVLQPKSDQPAATGTTALRAGQLLAKFDPPTTPDARERWNAVAKTLAEELTTACLSRPNEHTLLQTSMMPAASVLIAPLSTYIGAELDESRPRMAVNLLASYCEHDPAEQTRLCLGASRWQRPLIIPDGKRLRTDILLKELQTSATEGLSAPKMTLLAGRRAMAIVLLINLDDPRFQDDGFGQLKRSDQTLEISARAIAQSRFFELPVPVERLIQRATVETDPGILNTILIAVGDYPESSPAITSEFRSFVAEQFHKSPDAGVHSAAEWLLRRLGQQSAIQNLSPDSPAIVVDGPTAPRQWVRTANHGSAPGHTLVKLDGRKHDRVGRQFLISAHEVTVAQAKAFDPSQYYNAEYSRTPDSPMSVVPWIMAAQYCNWLSRQEGLPEFYVGDFERKPSTNDELKGLGYRLPTFEEWQLAASAQSREAHFFGTDKRLLDRYCWNKDNNEAYVLANGINRLEADGTPNYVSKPVGLLRPNDFGLFDVYGNVIEWCNDQSPHNPNEREMRGGAAAGDPIYMDTFVGGFTPIDLRYNSHGFRIARTLPDGNE